MGFVIAKITFTPECNGGSTITYTFPTEADYQQYSGDYTAFIVSTEVTAAA